MTNINPLHKNSLAVQREVLSGDALTIAQVAREQPPSRAGRPVTPSCVWRWAQKGFLLPDGRRVRLEACRVGCRWLTSRAALARFVAAQNPPPEAEPAPPQPPPAVPPGRRAAELEQARAVLRARGI